MKYTLFYAAIVYIITIIIIYSNGYKNYMNYECKKYRIVDKLTPTGYLNGGAYLILQLVDRDSNNFEVFKLAVNQEQYSFSNKHDIAYFNLKGRDFNQSLWADVDYYVIPIFLFVAFVSLLTLSFINHKIQRFPIPNFKRRKVKLVSTFIPLSLEEQLTEALEAENYKLAARLRDKLKIQKKQK